MYERRQAIITGSAEPTDGDVEAGKAADSDDEDDEEEEEKSTEEGADVKGIPEFWLTALKNAMPIAEQITDNDEEVSLTLSLHIARANKQVLKSLNDIRLSYTEDSKPGFKLHFFFGQNDFFTNTELTKTYYYQVSCQSRFIHTANKLGAGRLRR